jgi:hypothetical protein
VVGEGERPRPLLSSQLVALCSASVGCCVRYALGEPQSHPPPRRARRGGQGLKAHENRGARPGCSHPPHCPKGQGERSAVLLAEDARVPAELPAANHTRSNCAGRGRAVAGGSL